MARALAEFLFRVLHGEPSDNYRHRREIEHAQLMAAINNLNLALGANSSALDENTAAIEALKLAWNQPAPNEEAVDAAAVNLQSQTARVRQNTAAILALIAPATPAPVPDPAPTV